MKYCLHNTLTDEYLQKADEIKVLYKDRKHIFDLALKYPEATFILDMHGTQEPEDWNEIYRLKVLCKDKFILAIGDFLYADDCKAKNIQFYYTFPINTMYDLIAAKEQGCVYALIDSPLTHMLPEVKAVGITLRVVPNVAYYSYIPRENGVLGSWIRPEDIDTYAEYIDAIEFENCDIKKESALYRLYAEHQPWLGDINLLITNLNYPAENRMIPPTFAEARIKCGQRCLAGAHCRLCYTYLNLANPELLEQYKNGN